MKYKLQELSTKPIENLVSEAYLSVSINNRNFTMSVNQESGRIEIYAFCQVKPLATQYTDGTGRGFTWLRLE